MNPAKLIEKAKTSAFYLWLLNLSFNRMIPFNRPHGFKIVEVGDNHVRTQLPFRKANLNHVRGLHACALATLTEITGGFLLATRLDPTKFRIILKKLEVNYLYQGKADAFAEFTATPAWFEQNIHNPLKTMDAVEVSTEVSIKDQQGNQLTMGTAYWQVKPWAKVKTQ